MAVRSNTARAPVSRNNANSNIGSNANPWVRPSDWPALPVILDSDQKFAGLLAVFPPVSPALYTTYLSFTCAGNVTIDWGDGGATENVASGVQANHIYDYAAIAGAATSRGYKAVVVTIVPQAGQNLTSINLQKQHPSSGSGNQATVNWLEISLAGSLLTSLTIAMTPSQLVSLRMLESVSIGQNAVTNWASMFNSCSALVNIGKLYTNAATGSIQAMFQSCSALRYVPYFVTTTVTGFQSIFAGCYNLRDVPLLNTVAVTSMSSAFASCYKLEKVPQFNTAAVTTFTAMFQSCFGLLEAPNLSFASVVNTAQMYQNCYSLTEYKWPLPVRSGYTTSTSMFQGCSSLRSVDQTPYTIPTSDSSNMFTDCVALVQPPVFTNTANVGQTHSMFTNCASLTSLDMPWSGFSQTIVNGCYNLSSLFLRAGPTGTGPNSSSQTINQTKMSQAAYEAMFAALGKYAGGTVGISVANAANPGSGTITNKTLGTTAGSTTVTCTDTSNTSVGCYIRGAGINLIPVTIDTAANTLNRVAHGIANDLQVSLTSLVTSTGVVTDTPYYVVNAAADTFQIALTVGGAAIDITGSNGSCTVRVPVTITAINTNVSFIISSPASATASITGNVSTIPLKRHYGENHGVTIT